jgi:signal transduction histidine kinase
VGLEQDELRHLFQPFFTQFDPSRHSSGDFGFCKRGLGLGLSIAKQFVEMHGGRINAERREEGGTRVNVYLPRSANVDEKQVDRGPPIGPPVTSQSATVTAGRAC